MPQRRISSASNHLFGYSAYNLLNVFLLRAHSRKYCRDITNGTVIAIYRCFARMELLSPSLHLFSKFCFLTCTHCQLLSCARAKRSTPRASDQPQARGVQSRCSPFPSERLDRSVDPSVDHCARGNPSGGLAGLDIGYRSPFRNYALAGNAECNNGRRTGRFGFRRLMTEQSPAKRRRNVDGLAEGWLCNVARVDRRVDKRGTGEDRLLDRRGLGREESNDPAIVWPASSYSLFIRPP